MRTCMLDNSTRKRLLRAAAARVERDKLSTQVADCACVRSVWAVCGLRLRPFWGWSNNRRLKAAGNRAAAHRAFEVTRLDMRMCLLSLCGICRLRFEVTVCASLIQHGVRLDCTCLISGLIHGRRCFGVS